MAFDNKPRTIEMLLHLASNLTIDELWFGIDDQDEDGIWKNSLGEKSKPPFLTTDQLLNKKANCSMIAALNGRYNNTE